MKRRRNGQRDQGAAAVEFVLVLPVLLVILFGIIDFGRLMHAKLQLAEAAREGARASELIVGAAAISAPVDLATAGHRLGRGWNRLYTWNFLRSLKRKSLAKLAAHPDIYDRRAVARARNLYKFDNMFTSPLHGFRDTDDYWTRASSKGDLARIAVPTLILHARNDPFLPGAHLPQPHEVSPAVTLDYPEEGGHVGFVSGPFPGHLDWLPERVIGYFTEALQHLETT